jgi:GNAT superfamily N-acetyltransferase
MSDLDRCLAFLRDHAFSVSRTGPAARFGTALLYEELPNVWSLNYLFADRELEVATAEDLAAEADRLLGGAGLRHRKVEVLDQWHGARLAGQFRELGWHVERDLVMPHRREPDRDVDTSNVQELSAEELAPAWVEGLRPDFGANDDVIAQLVHYRQVLADKAGARFFAARAEGRIVAHCDLYSNGHTAQIESVMTLEQFRNQGFASSLVMAALDAANAAGCTLSFLLADEADWPKQLYNRLGFESVGAVYEFTRRAPVSARTAP